MPTINVNVNMEVSPELPEKLARLFSIEKKSELQRYCENIDVSKDELFALITNCRQLGYIHDMRAYEKRYVDAPDFSKLSPIGTYKPGDTLNANDQKIFRKASAAMSQRRFQTVHVFVAPADRWHVLYFTQNDMQGEHWQHGPHVHFANWLWPEYTLDGVLKTFSDPTGWLHGSIHLRYSDEIREHRLSVKTTFGVGPDGDEAKSGPK